MRLGRLWMGKERARFTRTKKRQERPAIETRKYRTCKSASQTPLLTSQHDIIRIPLPAIPHASSPQAQHVPHPSRTYDALAQERVRVSRPERLEPRLRHQHFQGTHLRENMVPGYVCTFQDTTTEYGSLSAVSPASSEDVS